MTPPNTPSRRPAAVAALLACALAAPGASVRAQSSVTITGLVDVGVFRDFDDVRKVGTIQRSNIAIVGVEDLGGGLSATVTLSHRFDVDTGLRELSGSKPFWHGESTVGLKGRLGHLRVGRALDVIYAYDWAFDPWYNFDRIASPAWNNWHWNYATDRTSNNGVAEYGRLSNGVFYDTPVVGGFSAHFSGSFEDSIGPNGGTGSNGGVSLNYDRGPLALMAAASRNTSGDTIRFLAGKVAVGRFALMGAYDRSVFDGPINDSTATVHTLGVTYTLDPTTFKAGYGHRDVDGVKTEFVGLGASHALSKRTAVYVSAGRQMPKNGDSQSAYGVGVAHAF